MLKFITFLLVMNVSLISLSQTSVVVSGSTNKIKYGNALLIKNTDSSFYSDQFDQIKVNIENGTFFLKGKLDYPQMYRILLMNNDSEFITEPFFLDSGELQIKIDSNGRKNNRLESGLAVQVFGSKVQDEYVKEYLSEFQQVYERIENVERKLDECEAIEIAKEKSLCEIYVEKEKEHIRLALDSTLAAYALKNIKSPILPWLLSNAIFYHGYNKFLSNCYHGISDYLPLSMKHLLYTELLAEKEKSVGNTFPLLSLLNKRIGADVIRKKKYILIDFWFSSCKPCLRQFEELRHVYKDYSANGLEIIAISTDKVNKKEDYTDILFKNKYPWKQILDLNGQESKILGLSKYPTTYLIDSSGVIVAKNISPKLLEEFLKDNM